MGRGFTIGVLYLLIDVWFSLLLVLIVALQFSNYTHALHFARLLLLVVILAGLASCTTFRKL